MSKFDPKPTPVAKLEANLRALIEPERVNLVSLAYQDIKNRIDRFLERRLPNLRVEDVFVNSSSGDIPYILKTTTDYYQAEAQAWVELRAKYQLHPGFRRNLVLPAFEVRYIEGFQHKIQDMAEAIAESQIQIFLNRAIAKLEPVVERKGDYTVSHPEESCTGVQHFINRFSGGTWVGHLQFTWEDHVKFVAKLKIITNYSVNNKAYAQYPMTFHQCALDPTAEQEGRSGNASIETIWSSVGYNPPKASEEPKRPKWGKLVSGSVVSVNGKPVLLYTPGQVKKLGIPPDSPQIARIEVHTSSASIERMDGTKEYLKFTNDDMSKDAAIESNYRLKDNSGVAKRQRQDRAFAHFFS